MRDANSVWLNGAAFPRISSRPWAGRCVWPTTPTACPVRGADGAAAGAGVVFGAILGTGCGGGVVVAARPSKASTGSAGEWGHTPLPWPTRRGARRAQLLVRPPDCLERWISGTALRRDYARGHRREAHRREIVPRPRARRGGGRRGAGPLYRPAGPGAGGHLRHPRSRRDRVRRRHVEHDRALRPRAAGRSPATPSPTSSSPRSSRRSTATSSGVRGAAWLWPLETMTALCRDCLWTLSRARPPPVARPAARCAWCATPSWPAVDGPPRLRRLLRLGGEARPPRAARPAADRRRRRCAGWSPPAATSPACPACARPCRCSRPEAVPPGGDPAARLRQVPRREPPHHGQAAAD